MNQLIVACLEEHSVKPTLVYEPFHQRHLEGERATVSMGCALAEHCNLSVAKRLRCSAEGSLPTCDVLINNAGIMRNLDVNTPHALTDVTQEIDVALRGPIQMIQAFLPLLKGRPEALIVNVSSGLAFVPFPLSPAYRAANAGLHAYTRCLRVQLKSSRVAVVELAPPGTETKLFREEFQAEMKGQKAMPVKTLVDQAIAGIENGKTEIRPGLSNVLYLLSRLAPGIPFGQMAKMGSAAK